jgi:hypothetical protein
MLRAKLFEKIRVVNVQLYHLTATLQLVGIALRQLTICLDRRCFELNVLRERQLHPQRLPPLIALHVGDVSNPSILDHHFRLMVIVVI